MGEGNEKNSRMAELDEEISVCDRWIDEPAMVYVILLSGCSSPLKK